MARPKELQRRRRIWGVHVGTGPGVEYLVLAEGIVEAIAIGKHTAAEEGQKDLEVQAVRLVGTASEPAAEQRPLAGVR